jgi:hypothetical protein
VEFGLESDLEAGGSDGIEAVGDQPQLLQGVRDEIAGLGLSLTSVPVDAWLGHADGLSAARSLSASWWANVRAVSNCSSRMFVRGIFTPR